MVAAKNSADAPLAPPVKDLAMALGHDFADAALLRDALTHPSLAGGGKRVKRSSTAYERLEFLGDRVLGLVVAAWLYRLYPEASEGDLSKRHAALVNRDTLTGIARQIDLPKFLKVARSETLAARSSQTVLADACEAVIGAMYLDGGLEPVERFIHRVWHPLIDQSPRPPVDPKTALQEWVQGRGLPLPAYRVQSSEGPAHAPRFVIELSVKGQDSVTAEGASKREAQKNAAALMLAKLEG